MTLGLERAKQNLIEAAYLTRMNFIIGPKLDHPKNFLQS
jgi:hypothetical protein